MELLLLKLVGLTRPLASMEYAEPVFAILGVGLFVLLLGGVLIRAAVQQTVRFTAIDLFAVAFAFWALAGWVSYYEEARFSELLKLVLPVLSYTVVKNIVPDRASYRRVVLWILVGFAIPTLVSAALIVAKHPTAVDMVNYWTEVTRWKGVYTHSHNLGHSMTLFLMAMVLYVSLRDARDERWRLGANAVLVALGAVALFCLFMSQVRSAVLGLVVFLALYTFFARRRLFLLGTAAAALLVVATLPYWFAAMFPEFEVSRPGAEVDVLDLGSGRPRFWLNDLEIYAGLPVDQKLLGLGTGAGFADGEQLLGHNDWLGLLTQTGLIGVLLFLGLQLAILRAILRLPASERYFFLALFAAVNVMMAVSNSYAWRIQVSQLYYILLAFIEVPVGSARPAAQEAGGERGRRTELGTAAIARR